VGRKVRVIEGGYYSFKCPGCGSMHVIPTTGPIAWSFNGDLEKPTFQPSLLMNRDLGNPTVPRCHSFITDGAIRFLPDCTHSLAGQTVPMEDVD
jgi:hypothetical protein